MLEKILFLQHGGGNINIGQQVPAGTSPVTAIIITVILIAIIGGLWFVLTKKKKI